MNKVNEVFAKKRIYKLLGKLMRGEDVGMSSPNFTANNEMTELIELLTNHNPFIKDLITAKIEYGKVYCTTHDAIAGYNPLNETITFEPHYIEAVAKKKIERRLFL